MDARKKIRAEAAAMLALAGPVIVAQLTQMSMGFVDILLVAKLGKEALAAVGMGNAVFYCYLVFAFGIINAVNPMVAHAYGAGDHREIGRSVGAGVWLALGLSVIGFLIYWNTEPLLLAFGLQPNVAALAQSYTSAMSFGLPAMLIFGAFRGFTDGVGRTRVAMVISFPAIFINAFGDWALIYGEFGFPQLGVAGCGYATAAVRWSMLAMMLWIVARTREFRRYEFRRHTAAIDFRQMLRVLKIGLPIGTGHSMENGFFGLTSILMGKISTVAAAAHQVAVNVAAFTFMVPMGLGIATATRVGQALGRRDPAAAKLAGWVGIAIAGLFMSVTAIVFMLIPEQIASIYASDTPDVLRYAAGLLVIAGAFQIFDGIQVAAMGALRGMKDTTMPLVTNLLAYWIVGLPTGWLLGFTLGQGGTGLWWGLTCGLAVASVLHTLRFRRRIRGEQTEPEGELVLEN